MQFSADDHDLLISIYDDTLNIDEELVEEAWKAWANGVRSDLLRVDKMY